MSAVDAVPTQLERHVDQVEQGLAAIASVMAQPAELSFTGTHSHVERLQEAFAHLGGIHAAFAHLCERDNAGAHVGATHPVEYLTQRMGVSRATAFEWLSRGKALFGEPDTPPVEPGLDDASRKRQEEEARRRREKEKRAQEKARRAAREKKANEEKLRTINQALRNLNEHSDPGRNAIYADAMEAAAGMNPEELRAYVNDLVRRANRKGRKLDGKVDPQAAFKKRTAFFGAEDADGGSWMRIYADRASRALIEAALAGGDAPRDDKDTRTIRQRRFDHLIHILRGYSAEKAGGQSGVGTVVVTMTLRDLLQADPESLFTTNTGTELTPLEIVRLGLVGDSFVLQLDSATGVPLSLGRARFASIGQRLVLLAMQSVCAWNGCTKPGIELEAHHLRSYLDGGETAIDNLILLCREHHRCNNDRRDGAGGKGYFTKDPETGVVRHHPARGGPATETGTYQYRRAPGQRAKDPPLFKDSA